MGSVKDLKIIQKPTKEKCGRGQFTFSDRYSVFDWGEMPDLIDGKGAALCVTSAYFLEKLESLGIGTHYVGVVESGRAKRLSDLEKPQSSMEINLVRIVRPKLDGNKYDYSVYNNEKTNMLIPLEVIYRNSLPEGSSVFKRLKNGSLKLSDIGMTEMPAPGTVLDKPLFDVSTKLEATDRYMDWKEAGQISGLSGKEIEEMRKSLFTINDMISKEAKKVGLANEDGKVEFGYDENRKPILLDTLGTLDECRFTYKGMPVSKEVFRLYYRKTEWYKDVEDAKKAGGVDWKKLVKKGPEKLPKEFSELASNMYKASCNEITGREWFKNTPPLSETLNSIRKFI